MEEEERRRKEQGSIKALRERIARWREARDVRAYVEAASSLLENEADVEKAEELRQEIQWPLAYAESVDPLSTQGVEPDPEPASPLLW